MSAARTRKRILNSRRLILVIIVAVFIVKAVLSATAPPSSDLITIVKAANSNPNTAQPWTRLYAGILSVWNQTHGGAVGTEEWWSSPPLQMDPALYSLALLARLPILILDFTTMLAIYYVCLSVTSSKETAHAAMLIWALNPFVTFAAELWAAPDIAPTLLALLAVGFTISRRVKLSGLSLGLATALKLFPVLLLPVLALFWKGAGWKRKDLVAAAVLGLLGVSAYVSWVGYGSGSMNAWLGYDPVTQSVKNFLDFTPEIQLNLLVFALVVYYVSLAVILPRSSLDVTSSCLGLFLVYVAFTDIFPHYLLWLTPFLTLDAAINPRRGRLGGLLTLTVFFLGFLMTEAYMTPVGYSLFFIPIIAPQLPPASILLVQFLSNPITRGVLHPLLKALTSSMALVYLLLLVGRSLRFKVTHLSEE